VNVLIAVDCEERDIALFQNEFDGLAVVGHCLKDDMKIGLKTTVYPWAYGINKAGQIVTSTVCGNEEELSGAIAPFRRYILRNNGAIRGGGIESS
jgi:hypothetical protein